MSKSKEKYMRALKSFAGRNFSYEEGKVYKVPAAKAEEYETGGLMVEANLDDIAANT